jgi:hypothetical protein
MQASYKIDIDLVSGQSKTFSFIANITGEFALYGRFELSNMTSHLEVLA